MRQLAVLERLRDHWQLAQRTCDAESLGRRTRCIAHDALHVLDEASEPEPTPQLELLRIAQQAGLLGIECSPSRRDTPKLLVHSRPFLLMLVFPGLGSSRMRFPRPPALLARVVRRTTRGHVRLLILHRDVHLSLMLWELIAPCSAD